MNPLLLFSILVAGSYAQQADPSITKQQIYADFDTLFAKIKTVSPPSPLKMIYGTMTR